MALAPTTKTTVAPDDPQPSAQVRALYSEVSARCWRQSVKEGLAYLHRQPQLLVTALLYHAERGNL